MARSTDAQKAERLNAAHRLLARGQSVGEAALSLSRQFTMSRRQAYRYIEEAQLIGRPVPVVETATAVTFKLPPSLVDAVRARAAAEGTTISDMVSRALRAFLGEAVGVVAALDDLRAAGATRLSPRQPGFACRPMRPPLGHRPGAVGLGRVAGLL